MAKWQGIGIKTHWYWLSSELGQNKYVFNQIKLKHFNPNEYIIYNKKLKIEIMIQRTSLYCYKCSILSDYGVRFFSFKNASSCVFHIAQYFHSVEVLNAYKRFGIEFDLSDFNFNLAEFKKLIDNDKVIKNNS